MNADTSTELLILDPPASSREAVAEFVGGCIVRGLDLYIGADDRLPTEPPPHLAGVKAVLVDSRITPMPQATLDALRASGAKVYLIDAELDPAAPNARGTWRNPTLIDMLMLDASLTPHHPRQFARFARRDDGLLFNAMVERLLEAEQHQWYDATRYQWDALLDAYELTGDVRCLDHVRRLAELAIQQPNALDNCDTVTPLGPLLRLAALDDSASMRAHAVRTMDAYLADTPRWRGALVGFRWLPHHARAEVVWQVGTALCALARFTGEGRYLDIAVEQAMALDALLYDRSMGLWRHAAGDGAATGAIWGRCCGFVLLGLLRIVETLEGDRPQREYLAGRINTMADALVPLQHDNGFWSTVVDEPLSEPESSGTAWITAALERGMRLGIIGGEHRAAADRGWSAVKSRIWQGRYPGHNTATTVSPQRSYYVKRQLSPTGWTHFAFRAACERRRAKPAIAAD